MVAVQETLRPALAGRDCQLDVEAIVGIGAASQEVLVQRPRDGAEAADAEYYDLSYSRLGFSTEQACPVFLFGKSRISQGRGGSLHGPGRGGGYWGSA